MLILCLSATSQSSELPTCAQIDFKEIFGAEFIEEAATPIQEWVYEFLEGAESCAGLTQILRDLEHCDAGNRRYLLQKGLETAKITGDFWTIGKLEEAITKYPGPIPESFSLWINCACVVRKVCTVVSSCSRERATFSVI